MTIHVSDEVAFITRTFPNYNLWKGAHTLPFHPSMLAWVTDRETREYDARDPPWGGPRHAARILFLADTKDRWVDEPLLLNRYPRRAVGYTIRDGCHRLYAAYLLGIPTLPGLVDEEEDDMLWRPDEDYSDIDDPVCPYYDSDTD